MFLTPPTMVILFERVFLFGKQKGETEKIKVVYADGDENTAKRWLMEVKRGQYKRQINWVFLEEPTIIIMPEAHHETHTL